MNHDGEQRKKEVAEKAQVYVAEAGEVLALVAVA